MSANDHSATASTTGGSDNNSNNSSSGSSKFLPLAIIDASAVRSAVESNLKLIYFCNLRSTPEFEPVVDNGVSSSQLQLEFNTVQQLLRSTAESALIDQPTKHKYKQRHAECSRMSNEDDM
jgi:hypothetical protein